MREKVLLFFLVVLLFNIIAVQNERVMISAVQAQALPNMFITPSEIKNSSAVAGQEFTVKINITNVEHLFGWQANITYNNALLNITSLTKITRSTWFDYALGGPTAVQFVRNVNRAAGYLLVGAAKKFTPYDGAGANGNGTLAYITFQVVGNDRGTLLAFGDNTYLRTAVASDTMGPIEPFTAQDGSFDNRQPQVNTSPVAGFSYSLLGTGIDGERVEFSPSASHDTDAWLKSYYWNYGDGTSALYMYNRTAYIIEDVVHRGNWTVGNIIHAYEHVGLYTVSFTVTDSDGATDTFTTDVLIPGHDIEIKNVNEPYVAVMPGIIVPINVTVENNGNYTETFDVNAYYNESLIETKSTVDMPTHSVTSLIFNWNTSGIALGNYILKANASAVAGETYTGNNAYTDGVLTIAPSNVVQFQTTIASRIFITKVDSTSIAVDFSFDRAAMKIRFNVTGAFGWFANVTIPMQLLNASSPTAWIVKFDGTNISYTATSNGTHYFIYFEYTQSPEPRTVDIIGETAATPPVATFIASKTTAKTGESITFNASTSHDPDGTIESWSWNFGDSGTGSGEVINHSFVTYGIYNVTLTVTDNAQMTNSTRETITIIDYPVASFTNMPEHPLVNQTVTFDATGSNPVGGSITAYAWEFGDSQTATGATTTHSFARTGNYVVNLTVTDSEGLTNFTVKTIVVNVHDVSITSLIATPLTVKIGENVTIQVTVANQGNFTENFSVTVYRNDTEIETKQVSGLTAGNSQQLTISWNTAAVGAGAYTLKATASTVTGETETSDNSLIGSTVTVQKKTSSLTIDASPATLTLGTATTITGTLTPKLQGVTITLQFRLGGGTWNTIGTAITDSQGNYQKTWTPSTAGAYEIQAVWQGDVTTQASQSPAKTVNVNEEKATTENIPYVAYAVVGIAIIVLVIAAIYMLVLRRR